jgi:ubiquinone biosynthesis protein
MSARAVIAQRSSRAAAAEGRLDEVAPWPRLPIPCGDCMPSLLNTVRDLDRLRQIVAVLTSHGFGEIVQRTGLASLRPGRASTPPPPRMRLGERIREVLQDLGPSFVKLGQIVSTRPDLIPEDVIRELRKLQDEVPPEDYQTVRGVVESELGAPLGEVFSDFSEQALASASIAQVHRAKLRTDEGDRDVVVKVQRPQVKGTIERDLDLLYWLAHAIERSMPESRIYGPVRLVAEFDRAITAELDFTLEADNAERFSRNFEQKRFVRFPEVYRQASSRRVITLEYIDGIKLHDIMESGTGGETIAKRAVDMVVKQIFEDGFFHADPHPGNVFIMGDAADPTIALIDLGLVGRLTPRMRDRTIDLMVAAVREDYRGMADALYAIGRPTRKVDREAYEAEVTMLAQKYLGKQLGEIELSAMVRDLVYGARKYGLEVPSEFLMVGKTLMTVEGIGKQIYPQLDIFEEVKPYFLKLMYQRYSPERVSQDVMRAVMRLSGAAADMPMQVQEILEDLRKGAFRLGVQEQELRDAADRLGRRIFSGIVVGSLLFGAALLASREQWVLSGVAVGLSMAWGAGHSTLVMILNRRARR